MLSKFSRCMYTRFFAALSPAKKIAYLAVFIALGVVLNSFLEINLSGSNRITFTYFVCFFAGFLMGPLPGFAVGFVGDAIGFLLVPQDIYWFFGVTLGLIGVISGIARKLPLKGRKGIYLKTLIAFAASYLLITCFLNSLVNYSYMCLFIWKATKKTFWVYLVGRLTIQSVVFAINAVACALVVGVISSMRSLRFFEAELRDASVGERGETPAPKTF